MPKSSLKTIRASLLQCIDCGARAVQDHRYCQKHLDYHRAMSRASRLAIAQRQREGA